MQVCPIPDIKRIPLQNDYDFMIIACDGIWDVYKNEEAVELAFMTREAIKNKKVTKKIKSLISRWSYTIANFKDNRKDHEQRNG